MRMIYALLILILTTACGPLVQELAVTRPLGAPDASTQMYVREFERAYGHPVLVPVVLVKHSVIMLLVQDQSTIGVCAQDRLTVFLDVDYWEKANGNARWSLLFHELGHCVLNREHSDAIDESGCPASVMWPAADWPARCLDSGDMTRSRYQHELFQDDQGETK
jgi:hypothetical protein